MSRAISRNRVQLGTILVSHPAAGDFRSNTPALAMQQRAEIVVVVRIVRHSLDRSLEVFLGLAEVPAHEAALRHVFVQRPTINPVSPAIATVLSEMKGTGFASGTATKGFRVYDRIHIYDTNDDDDDNDKRDDDDKPEPLGTHCLCSIAASYSNRISRTCRFARKPWPLAMISGGVSPRQHRAPIRRRPGQ